MKLTFNGKVTSLKLDDEVHARIGGRRGKGISFFVTISFYRGSKRLVDSDHINSLVNFDTSEDLEQILDIMAGATGMKVHRISDDTKIWKWKFFEL